MLESIKDKVFVGRASGLVHNSVFEGDRVGMTGDVAERMRPPGKFEAICRAYQEMRKPGMGVVIGGDCGFQIMPMGQSYRDIGHFVENFGYSPAEERTARLRSAARLWAIPASLGLSRGARGTFCLSADIPLPIRPFWSGRSVLAMIMKGGRIHRDPRDRLAAYRRGAAE